VEICNVLNWIQKIVLHCAVLLIVIALQLTVQSWSVVNWIQRIVLHCPVLLIIIAVQQAMSRSIVITWIIILIECVMLLL